MATEDFTEKHRRIQPLCFSVKSSASSVAIKTLVTIHFTLQTNLTQHTRDFLTFATRAFITHCATFSMRFERDVNRFFDFTTRRFDDLFDHFVHAVKVVVVKHHAIIVSCCARRGNFGFENGQAAAFMFGFGKRIEARKQEGLHRMKAVLRRQEERITCAGRSNG